MKKQPNTVYIGYDPREDIAYEVLKFTIERIAVENVRIVVIRRDVVERMGIYKREYDIVDGQHIDKIDGRPFSSEFSFTRFLVPALNMYQGWASIALSTNIIRVMERRWMAASRKTIEGRIGRALSCGIVGTPLIKSLLLLMSVLDRADGYMDLNGSLIRKQTLALFMRSGTG